MKKELFERLGDYKEIKTSSVVKEELEEQGYEVVFPKNNELQIDIDSEEEYQIFKEQYEILCNHWGKQSFEIKEEPSFSGLPHRHIVVTCVYMENIFEDIYKRIAFQACLGSDVKREMLNLLAVEIYEDKTPSLFIKKKGEK